MSRSKSRSGIMEFGKKNQKSILSRAISASVFCRGDPFISQINSSALKELDRNNSHGANSSEAVNQLKKELKMTKAQLEMAEQEKDRTLDEFQEMKMEIEVSKQNDTLLMEKDMLIDGLEVELSIFKASRSVIMESLSNCKKKIKELEQEIALTSICENESKLANSNLGNVLFQKNLENLDNYEMKSRKAIDDLALVLNESKLEIKNAYENLQLKEEELEKVKEEGVLNAKLLTETKRENERYKNTLERLRLEADESHLAWNEREIGFVNCVNQAEDERARLQQENICLIDLLKSANTTIDMFREENLNLKSVLKQATSIANIKKDDDLDYLVRENRMLGAKELNRPLIIASIKDPSPDFKRQGVKTKFVRTMFDESRKGNLQNNRLSFDLGKLKKTILNEDVTIKEGDEVPIKAEILTRWLFDNADLPKLLSRRVSFSFLNGKIGVNSEDIDDSGNNWIWKRRAILQTFQDLIKGRSVEKEEKSVE